MTSAVFFSNIYVFLDSWQFTWQLSGDLDQIKPLCQLPDVRPSPQLAGLIAYPRGGVTDDRS